MATSRRLLLHLAACAAGWGIVTAFKPTSSSSAESRAATKSFVRDTLDREQGEKLLRRLAPDITPAPPAAVKHHEGTLEERVMEEMEDDPFAEGLTKPTDKYIIDCLGEQIRIPLFGEDGPDLSYAFQHGRMEAPEVLATLRQILPDLARESLFDKVVFICLFQIDPIRAAGLLDTHAPAARSSLLLEAIIGQSGKSNPESVLAWSHLVPPRGDKSDDPFADSVNQGYASDFYKEYGNDYTGWLLDQPPSKSRELMVEALMEHLVMEDPAAAVALRKRLSTR